MSEDMNFDMQEDILLDLAKSGTLSHAVIVESENVQKAYEFLMNVVKIKLCFNDDKPCGKCNNCIKIGSNSHPDIKTVEVTGKSKSIKIDDIRKIREDAYIISNEGSDKFYIIKDADFMTVQAQNALIKILEEPPKNVIFLLICTSCGNLISTIRSRAHIFKIKNISEDEESNISVLAKKIVKASLCGESDKILEYMSGVGSDRKEFKLLMENIIERFIEFFKSENIDKKLADGLILRLDKLMELANLVDKNVNMNLLMAVVCSCL